MAGNHLARIVVKHFLGDVVLSDVIDEPRRIEPLRDKELESFANALVGLLDSHRDSLRDGTNGLQHLVGCFVGDVQLDVGQVPNVIEAKLREFLIAEVLQKFAILFAYINLFWKDRLECFARLAARQSETHVGLEDVEVFDLRSTSAVQVVAHRRIEPSRENLIEEALVLADRRLNRRHVPNKRASKRFPRPVVYRVLDDRNLGIPIE